MLSTFALQASSRTKHKSKDDYPLLKELSLSLRKYHTSSPFDNYMCMTHWLNQHIANQKTGDMNSTLR